MPLKNKMKKQFSQTFVCPFGVDILPLLGGAEALTFEKEGADEGSHTNTGVTRVRD